MINVNEFVPKLFLKLTSKTYPYGYEDIVVDEMVKLGYLPKDISKDSHGNYFYQIGESRSIFAAHLDTVSSKHQDVKHVLDGIDK
jgi:putative aminopeptidase FrvX